jgi:von Willebrand factor type A domain
MRSTVTKLLVLAIASVMLAPIIGAQSASRFVLAKVTNGSGEPLIGLGADDFVVYEGNEPRETLNAMPAAYPVAVLIDTTSAARQDFITMRTAVRQFVDRMSGRDVAIYTFGERALRVLDFTRDPVKLQRAVDGLFAPPDAESHLLDAIIEASRDIKKRESPVTLITVISAGGNDQSNRTPREVFDAVLATRSIVRIIDMRTVRASGRLNNVRGRRSSTGDRSVEAALALEEVLRGLASRTQGEYTLIYTATAYQTHLDQLRRTLAGEMIVEYASPSQLDVAASGVRLGTRISGAVVSGVGLERAPRDR